MKRWTKHFIWAGCDCNNNWQLDSVDDDATCEVCGNEAAVFLDTDPSPHTLFSFWAYIVLIAFLSFAFGNMGAESQAIFRPYFVIALIALLTMMLKSYRGNRIVDETVPM